MVQFMVQCQMVQLCQLVPYDVRWCMQVNDVLTDDVVCGMLYLAMRVLFGASDLYCSHYTNCYASIQE